MLSWLFKKPGPTARAAAPTRAAPAAAPSPAKSTAATPAAPETPAIDWPALLQAAQGDDAALLQLARHTGLLEVKLAAVQGLAGEDALRRAEREFRDHDRKVHRLAKQRLEAAVAQRGARAQAQTLLARTLALLDEDQVAANHLVDLDRAWQALPAPLLEVAQAAQFAALRERLGSQTRERADALQRRQRWAAEAQRLLRGWPARLQATAGTGSAEDAAQLGAQVQALRQARPDDAAAALDAALAQAQQDAAGVQAALALLETAPPPATTAPDAPAPASAETPPALPDDPPAVASLAPAVAPALDGVLAQLLAQRQVQWLRTHTPVPPAAPATAAPAATTPASKPAAAADPARRAAQAQRLQARVEQAEAALAEGRFAALQQQLQALEAAMANAGPGVCGDEFHARVQVLRAERGRLKDWQQWGAERARADLLTEAEALARQTLAAPAAAPPTSPLPLPLPLPSPSPAPSPEVTPAPTPATASEPPAAAAVAGPAAGVPTRRAPRLNLKAHAASLQALRQRWKALDHQGVPAGPEAWQRFDAALQTAHQPLAALHAAQQAQRLDNLATRTALLTALQAQALPAVDAADWRECQRALDRFHGAWRKLGPLEHTVPAASRAALLQHLQAALAGVEAPLQAAQQAAAAEREQLVARAESLQRESQAERPFAEAARGVRELQSAWQDHARHLPLPRPLEAALWARFKAATDGVFAQRDAALSAREAALNAQVAEREALLQRLQALGPELPAAELGRVLAEVDRAWRQAAALPRGPGQALEERYRAARAGAAQNLAAASRQRWQAQCDTLAARLALCAERETLHAAGNAAPAAAAAAEAATPGHMAGAAAAPAEASLAERWAGLGPLPAPWAQVLAARWAQPALPGPLPAAEMDALLLRLEVALALPATPEQQAARQRLKLQALKDAMEGRAPPQQEPAQQAAWLLATLRQAGGDAPQRARLQTVVAALREAPPGALGTPVQAE